MKSKIETSYGKANILEINTLGENNGTVFIAPGYGELGTKHFEKLAKATSEHGFKVITFDQPSKSGDTADPLERRSDVVLEVLASKLPDGEAVDAVAHSLGAQDTLRATLKAPHLFKSITLIQPAGLTGEQSLLGITGNVSQKVVNNQVNAMRSHPPLTKDTESRASRMTRITKSQVAGGNALGKNPALALREANAARQLNITELIAEVRELGIPVNLITSQGDELFPYTEVEEWVEEHPDMFTSWSQPAVRGAGHDDSWIRPETMSHVIADVVKRTGALAVRDVVRVGESESE